jgi:hypothetical protein
MAKKSKNWIEGLKKGGLHRSTGTPMGQKIPANKIAKAAKSGNPKVRRQAAAAKTLAKLRAK